jgi:hypothetical protein
MTYKDPNRRDPKSPFFHSSCDPSRTRTCTCDAGDGDLESVKDDDIIKWAGGSRLHVDQYDDGERPRRTPQPSLVEEWPTLDQVKNDEQGQRDDEDLIGAEQGVHQLRVPLQTTRKRVD